MVTSRFDETTATNQTITGLGTYYASEFNENVVDSIVTSGLVMNLDAGSVSSYPGIGITWTDLSGNGNNGTFGTFPTTPTYNSANNGSIVFDGTDDKVDCGNSATLQITQGTISAWIKADSANVGFNGIITKQLAWSLFVKDNILISYDWGNATERSTGITVGNGTWNHVAMTFTETVGTPSNNAIIYVNGSPVLTTTVKHSAQTAPVQIGDGNNTSQNFGGNIAQASVYNRVLSAKEILRNYNAAIGRFGPFLSNPLIANVFPPYENVYDEFAGVLYGSGQGTFMRQKTDNTLTVYNEINEVGLDESYSITPELVLTNDGGTATFQIFAYNVLEGTQLYYEIVDSPVAYVTSGLALNLDAGNIASYPGSGTTWTDISGNGKNGTLILGPTYSSANGGSIVFDGANDYVNIGVNKGVNEFSGDFTVSVWIMVDPSSIAFGNIIGDYFTNSISTTNEWQLMMGTGAQITLYRVGRGYIFNSIPSGYATNTWINVTISRIDSTLSLYSNGNLLATTPSSQEIFGTNTGNFNIGIDGNNTSEPFKGKIANVMIYKNKGLSESEVLQNFNALKDRFYPSIVTSGLVINLDAGNASSYPGSGTTWTDLSGNGNNGTLTLGPTYSSANNGSIVFDGTNDHVIATRPSSIVTGGEITISLWAKWLSTGTDTSTIQVLIDNDHRNSPLQGFVIQDRPDLGKSLTFSSKPDINGAVSTFVVGDGSWHHIAGTCDGSTVKLYIDGNLNAQVSQSGGLATVQPNITLGRWQGAGSPARHLNGNIAQASIYNRALSASEVLQNFNALKGRFGL
jgi:hypothetical protein